VIRREGGSEGRLDRRLDVLLSMSTFAVMQAVWLDRVMCAASKVA